MRLLFLILISISSFGQATFHSLLADGQAGYFVDNDATGNEITPSELIALLPTIPQNSNIYFEAGETFVFDSLSINVDGLTFSRYGSGVDPIITGSINMTDSTWVHKGSNLYYTLISDEINGILMSGVLQKIAQTDYISITAHPLRTQISANATTLQNLNNVQSIVGSGIVAKEFSFRPTFQRTVTTYNGTTTITLDAEFQDNSAPAVGYGFKLINKRNYITDVGEWSWDGDTLYVKTDGGAPSNIRGIRYDYGIVLESGADDITITDITFTGQYLGGIYSKNNDRLLIDDCDLHDITVHAITLVGGGDDIRVTNDTIYNVINNAIHVGRITNSEIDHNYIHNIGDQDRISIPVYADIFRSVGVGIHCRWDVNADSSTMRNVRIHHNFINDVGYIGITLVGKHNVFENNLIDGFMLQWNDGGGIYGSSRPYGTGYVTELDTIRYNIIRNGVGVYTGTPETASTAIGIYLDNASTQIVVDNNTIEKAPYCGILINFDTSFNTITDNTVVDAVSGVSFREDSTFNYGPYNPTWSVTFPKNEGNVFTGNIISARSTAQVCVQVYSANNDTNFNPFVNGGNADNNYYLSPYRINIAMHKASSEVLYPLSGWQTKLGEDGSSAELTNYLLFVNSASADIDILLTTNPSDTDITGNDPGENYADIFGDDVVTQTIPAWGGVINIAEFKVLDTFTGSSVAITSHTPEKGGSYTLNTGTSTIDGSGYLVASVAAQVTQSNTTNTTLTTIGRVTTTASNLNLLTRYTDTNKYIQVQLNFTDNKVKLISRVGGTNTVLSESAAGSLSTNTDYTLKVKIVGDDVWVHFNNVLFISAMDNATIAANHMSSTSHGILVSTTAKYDIFKIVGGFTP